VCIHIATTGIDLQSLASEVLSGGTEDADIGRKAFHLQNILSKLQESFTVLEKVVWSCFLILFFK